MILCYIQAIHDDHQVLQPKDLTHISLPLRGDGCFRNLAIFSGRSSKRALTTSRNSFHRMFATVKGPINKNREMGILPGQITVPPDISLGKTLRLLERACYLDTMMAFVIGVSTVYNIFHEICLQLIDKAKLPPLSVEQRLRSICGYICL